MKNKINLKEIDSQISLGIKSKEALAFRNIESYGY